MKTAALNQPQPAGGPPSDVFRGLRKKPRESEWVTMPFYFEATPFLKRVRNRFSAVLRHYGIDNLKLGCVCWTRYQRHLDRGLNSRIRHYRGFTSAYALRLGMANGADKFRYQLCFSNQVMAIQRQAGSSWEHRWPVIKAFVFRPIGVRAIQGHSKKDQDRRVGSPEAAGENEDSSVHVLLCPSAGGGAIIFLYHGTTRGFNTKC